MCGRYAFFTIKGLQELFNIRETELNSVTPSYNIAPYTDVCTIANGHIKSMYWQLIPSFSNEFKTQYSMFDTRLESFSESKFKRELLNKQRCLIPADNYYEWKKESKAKTPYLFRKRDSSLIYFAGIYSVWKDRTNNIERYSCSIITKNAVPEIAEIHPRMPLIIQNSLVKNWISESSRQDIDDIINESAGTDLEFYQVSNKVNKTENNFPELTLPVEL